MRIRLALLCCSLSGLAFAKSPRFEHVTLPDAPWLTGPLLAPSGHVVPIGYWNIEPYLYVTDTNGNYNANWDKVPQPGNWSISLQAPFWVGLTEWMDVQISPTWNFNFNQGAFSTVFGDFPVVLDFGILKDRQDNYYPAFKLAIKEVFPTGAYQDLDPHKQGTDSGGGGSYVTSLGFVLSRLIHIWDVYWTNIRLGYAYNIPSRVHVHGLSTYGGAVDTDGIVYPAQNWQYDLGFEFTISRNWAIACDFVGNYTGRTHFKGHPGTLASGAPAVLETPASSQYSLAPAIEYNWNEALGVITGAWFTFAGQNAPAFVSWVSALNYYY